MHRLLLHCVHIGKLSPFEREVVVVAQSEEWSLPTPGVCNSNPVIYKKILKMSRLLTVKLTQIKKKGAGKGTFLTSLWKNKKIVGLPKSARLQQISAKYFKYCWWWPVWPELAIFCTLGNFLKPFATINLPKSPTFLDNFCKRVKIYHFSS